MGSSDDNDGGPTSPSLGRLGRLSLSTIRRRGMWTYVVSISLVTSATAVSIGLGVAFLADFEPSYKWWTFVLCATIPLLITPTVLYAIGRLILHLDETSEQLRTSSLTDALTGTSNRRGFFEAVAAIDARPGQEYLVALVDIDDFKDVNDTHGHAIGDDGLVLVSAWLQLLVGDTGIVARMGGDEFATVCDTDRADSIPESMEFIHRSVRFTASIGTAPYTPGEQRIETALANADTAMYTRKSDSRSRRSTR